MRDVQVLVALCYVGVAQEEGGLLVVVHAEALRGKAPDSLFQHVDHLTSTIWEVTYHRYVFYFASPEIFH